MRRGTWVAVMAVGVVALAFVAWVLWPTAEPAGPAMARSATANGVTVTATLQEGHAVVFDVVLDTHSVDLADFDVAAHAYVVANGVRIEPDEVSRSVDDTGHHVEATLTFRAERRGVLVLVVEDLAGVPERRLEFAA